MEELYSFVWSFLPALLAKKDHTKEIFRAAEGEKRCLRTSYLTQASEGSSIKTMSDIEEAQRLVAYLQGELERQRAINAELRTAVADMARAFQETLARANDAAETGDLDLVRRITFENRAAWQSYLQQIMRAAKPSGKEQDDSRSFEF